MRHVQFKGPALRRLALAGVILAAVIGPAGTQVPGPQPTLAQGAELDPAQIEDLVAPYALYPDELLAVVLQASMQPMQIVHAARFLDQVAKNKAAKPNDSWSEPVKTLLNYPDVLHKLNDDLDHTEILGQAMQAQQEDVLAAVQQFRRRAAAAGNLHSDDKVTVTQDGDVYYVEAANPQVIYVPVYDPAVVVVPQPAPVQPVYVPTPYPAYYEALPAAATGFFFGALTTAWAMNWHNYHIDEDNIREFQQSRQQSLSQRQQSRQDAAAQRQQSRQQTIQGRQPAQLPAAAGAGTGAGAGARPGTGAGARPGAGTGGSAQDLRATLGGQRPAQGPAAGNAGQRPAVGQQPANAGRPAQRPGYQPQQRQGGQAGAARAAPSAGAFSYGSGRSAVNSSNRGAQSRSFSGGGGGGRGGRR